MKKKDKLIYVFAFRSSFIRKDEELLKKHFDVVPLFFNPLPRWKTPLSFIKQVFQLLANIRNCKGIVCQFAGFHTVAAVIVGKLFGVKTSIILLGAECHNYPGIQHGNFRKKMARKGNTFFVPMGKSASSYR
jgi:UDP-N-acetylglucosamine:LPS N-acetylglucosamine transferase